MSKMTQNKSGSLFCIRYKSTGKFFGKIYRTKHHAISGIKARTRYSSDKEQAILDLEIVEYKEDCTHSILFELDKFSK